MTTKDDIEIIDETSSSLDVRVKPTGKIRIRSL